MAKQAPEPASGLGHSATVPNANMFAYSVRGIAITAGQRDAGIAAMNGRFRKNDVRAALVRAGVPYSVMGEPYLADRAADRLLQAERKAGRVRAVHNKLWERVS